MKKFLLITATIIVSVFIVDRLLDVILTTTIVNKSQFRFSRYVHEKQMEDIYVIGSSRGVNSFEESLSGPIFHKSGLNLSFNSMTMEMIRIITKDICRKAAEQDKNPVILIEASAMFEPSHKSWAEDVGALPEYNLYSGYFHGLDRYYKTYNPTMYWTNQVFKCYKYNSELFYRNIYYLHKKDDDWIETKTINPRLVNETENMKPFLFYIDTANAACLKEIMAVAKKSHVTVKLFMAPYLPEFLHKIQNIKQLEDTISTMAGSRVIDLTSLLGDDKCFADRLHTNTRCVAGLMGALKEKGKL